mmetsp:Transcript_72251/g.160622  ORF Transcript_72251/g.160622 Transcript_72251/m.160622 type:complete len:252 (+) Transcript_72251:109-864(+)
MISHQRLRMSYFVACARAGMPLTLLPVARASLSTCSPTAFFSSSSFRARWKAMSRPPRPYSMPARTSRWWAWQPAPCATARSTFAGAVSGCLPPLLVCCCSSSAATSEATYSRQSVRRCYSLPSATTAARRMCAASTRSEGSLPAPTGAALVGDYNGRCPFSALGPGAYWQVALSGYHTVEEGKDAPRPLTDCRNRAERTGDTAQIIQCPLPPGTKWQSTHNAAARYQKETYAPTLPPRSPVCALRLSVSR